MRLWRFLVRDDRWLEVDDDFANSAAAEALAQRILPELLKFQDIIDPIE